MARGVNRVILVGHVGSDPKVRYTGAGTPVSNFSVATNERMKVGDEWKDRTEWHRIVVWGGLAETCAKYLSKGSKLYLEGRLQTRQWEDKSGNKRTNTEIVAESVVFLDGAAPKTDTGGSTHHVDDDEIPF